MVEERRTILIIIIEKNETFAERMALNPIWRCGGAPIFISTSAANSVDSLQRTVNTVAIALCILVSIIPVDRSKMASTFVVGLGVATAAFLVRMGNTPCPW